MIIDMNPEEILNILFVLIKEVVFMATVMAVIVSSVNQFKEVAIEKKFTYKNQVIMIFIFGFFSILANYSGIKLPSGAIANVRDMGPLVAGLVGGPVIGLGAGLIGGITRYFGDGFTTLPCSIATISAGIIGGLVYKYNKGEFVGAYKAMIIAVLVELCHMGFILILARPFDAALDVVKVITVPMVLSNVLGITIFFLIISNMIKERKKKKTL